MSKKVITKKPGKSLAFCSGANWCWARCTIMATQYYRNNTSECEIVEWVRVHIALPNRGYNDCCINYLKGRYEKRLSQKGSLF